MYIKNIYILIEGNTVTFILRPCIQNKVISSLHATNCLNNTIDYWITTDEIRVFYNKKVAVVDTEWIIKNDCQVHSIRRLFCAIEIIEVISLFFKVLKSKRTLNRDLYFQQLD